MKPTTKDWLTASGDDLFAAKILSVEEQVTNLAAFHCQQCVEKVFKALIEEQDKPSIKSHDLLRLQLYSDFQLSDNELIVLGTINEVYIDSRYPGELGLLPEGKPTKQELDQFILFCESLLVKIKNQITKLT